MVVEHVFVTTLEAAEAMSAAMRFLSRNGFVNDAGQGFFVGGEQWNVLDMRRGVMNARSAKSVRDLPQRVHMEYDRGRITMALSIEAGAAWGGKSSFSTAVEGNPRKMRLHESMLMSLATGLEALLVKGETPAIAEAQLLAVEQQALAEARSRSRRLWIILSMIILFFAVLITLAITYG